MMKKQAKEKYDSLIDDALKLINTPTNVSEENLSAKAKRACARAKLETIMEKRRLQAEMSEDYQYLTGLES